MMGGAERGRGGLHAIKGEGGLWMFVEPGPPFGLRDVVLPGVMRHARVAIGGTTHCGYMCVCVCVYVCWRECDERRMD